MKDSDFKRIPVSQITITPVLSGHYELYAGRWWAVTEDDCILLYGRGLSKQCNSDRRITDRFVSAPDHPATKAVYLDAAWFGHNCHDYV